MPQGFNPATAPPEGAGSGGTWTAGNLGSHSPAGASNSASGTASVSSQGAHEPAYHPSNHGPNRDSGYSSPQTGLERLFLQQPSRKGGYWDRVRADWRAANRIVPGMMAPPGLGLVLGAGRTFATALGLPTFFDIAGSTYGGAATAGSAAEAAGGGFSTVLGAGAEGAGMGLTAAGGWAAVGGAAAVGAVGIVGVGFAFEGGLFLGSMITGALP